MTTKNILIAVGVLVFIIILYFIFSGSSSTTTTGQRMAQPTQTNVFSAVTSLANAASVILGKGGNPNTSVPSSSNVATSIYDPSLSIADNLDVNPYA